MYSCSKIKYVQQRVKYSSANTGGKSKSLISLLTVLIHSVIVGL